MRRLLVIYCLLLSFQQILHAQQNASAIMLATAPANASAAYIEKWTFSHNPAVLSSTANYEISAIYNNRFAMKETSSAGVSAIIPTKHVDIGVGMNFFGYSKYNEIQGGVAVSHKFSKYFQLGVQFNYYSVYFSPEEGSKGNLVAQIGLLTEVLPRFYIGFSAFNVSQSKIGIGATEKRIPSVFALGASYYFSDNFVYLLQLDKEIDYNLQWRTGFEYKIIDQLAIRLGAYGSPFVPTLGASTYLKKFRVDLNFERHPNLGINSACGLSYSI